MIPIVDVQPGPSSSFSPGLEGEDGGPLSRALAVGSVSTAVALFLFTRIAGQEPTQPRRSIVEAKSSSLTNSSRQLCAYQRLTLLNAG